MKAKVNITRRIRGAAAALVVVAAGIGGTIIATSASAGAQPGGGHRHPGFGVFSHPLVRAHVASFGGEQPRPGSVLAATPAHPAAAIYATRTGGNVCVTKLSATGGGGSCGPIATVEETGLGVVKLPADGSPVGVTLLLPNGVTSITVTDTDGKTRQVPVTNNVVSVEETGLSSVNYALPSGQTKSTDLASFVAAQQQLAESHNEAGSEYRNPE